MIDLLDEVKSEAGGRNISCNSLLTNKMSSDTIITISHTQAIFGPINGNIANINIACNQIEKLYGVKRTGLPSEQKKALQEVDQVVVRITPLIRDTKRLLENAKASHQQNKKAMKATDRLLFENMFNSMSLNYQSAIKRYQDSTNKFRSAVREDFTRQAKIIDPQISPQQIQKMLQAKDPAQYMQTHIMAISPQILQEVAELEEEHQRVKKLENTIAEIQELFDACAGLVVEAGEKLDQIEQNVEQTMNAAETGKHELGKAEHYVVQTRKTKMKIVALCVGVVGVIILVLALAKMLNLL
eukprot:212003_1